MAFSIRTIERARTLGARLGNDRATHGWTLEKASRETQIDTRLIEAMEEDRWDDLPAEPMRSHLTKRYLRTLGDDPGIAAIALPAFTFEQVARSSSQKKSSHTLAPNHLRAGTLAILFLGLITYLGIQVHTLISPPTLAIETPFEGTSTSSPTIDIHGTTESVATVSINDQPVLKDVHGAFTETVNLERGVNIISISATKRYSGQRTMYRTVIYEEPPVSYGPSRPETSNTTPTTIHL